MIKALPLPSSVRIRVLVSPRACADEVLEWTEGTLRIRVAAPARRGRADEAVESLLAEVLCVNRDQVRVVAGRGARRKCLEIEHFDERDLELRLPGRHAPPETKFPVRPVGAAAAVRPAMNR